MSAASGWIATQTAWIAAYGPIGWWAAALFGGLLFASMFLAISLGRWKLVQAKALNEWSKLTDAINPMDREFRNQRIDLAKLANPITKQISGKRFINCELIGPVTILIGPNRFRDSQFISVNMIPVKDNYPMQPIITMVACDVIESQIMDANILFPLSTLPALEAGFPGGAIQYLSLTGDAAIDSR